MNEIAPRPWWRMLNRRDLLRWLAVSALGTTLPRSLRALASGSFAATNSAFPAEQLAPPRCPAAAPPGATQVAFDIFGNYWCLDAADPQGHRRLLVLAAQTPGRWSADTQSGLPPDAWRFTGADEFGYVWIASSGRCLRLDPHEPEKGWTDFSAEIFAPHAKTKAKPAITAMGVAASGAIVVALAHGELVELDRTETTTTLRSNAPAGVTAVGCDCDGTTWLRCGDTTYRCAAPADAWQRQWQLVDRLPAGDHDLSGDILDGSFYMAGGQNAGWGYPAKPHVFREIFCFEPTSTRWRVVAELPEPRFYNGTSQLGGRVWIIGGYTRDAAYKPVLLSSVVLFNPSDSTLTSGPSLPIAVINPLALNIDGRIYVAGFDKSDSGERACQMLSIGEGEDHWRREPDGPTYRLALAGTAHGGIFYLALPDKGLACFDTRQRRWSMLPYPHPARSPQLATYRDEIWVLGGRDIDRQDRTLIYSPGTGQWRTGPSLPRDLAWGAATTVAGRLLVVGGAAGRSYNNRTFLLRERPLIG